MKPVRYLVGTLVLSTSATLWVLAFGRGGEAQIASAPPTQEAKLAGDEIALAEEVAASRERYLKGLEKLHDFYVRTHNDFKTQMAAEELDGLRKVTTHDYIIVAESLGPNLRPLKSVAQAETLFAEARALDTRGCEAADANRRKALALYNDLLARYPESNRIAEAAFYAGQVYETVVKDPFSAVVYYQRTYQWDPQTSHPARILAGRLCYYKIKDMRRAKGFYQAAADSDPTPAFRAEGKAMADALTAMGY